MPAATVDAKTQLAAAVRLAREYRCSPRCNCCNYRDLDDEGFCNQNESRWNKTVDRLISMCQENL